MLWENIMVFFFRDTIEDRRTERLTVPSYLYSKALTFVDC